MWRELWNHADQRRIFGWKWNETKQKRKRNKNTIFAPPKPSEVNHSLFFYVLSNFQLAYLRARFNFDAIDTPDTICWDSELQPTCLKLCWSGHLNRQKRGRRDKWKTFSVNFALRFLFGQSNSKLNGKESNNLYVNRRQSTHISIQ